MTDECIRLAIDVYVIGVDLLIGMSDIRWHRRSGVAVIVQIIDGHRVASEIKKQVWATTMSGVGVSGNS